jgi:hypothetical protein
MGHLVRIVLPDRDGKGPIREDARTDDILGRIVKRWGGCTCYRAEGLWNPEGLTDDQHRVISDHVVVCECSIGLWTEQVREWWHDLAASVARTWDQECVYLSVQAETAMLIGQDGMSRLIGQGGEVDKAEDKPKSAYYQRFVRG